MNNSVPLQKRIGIGSDHIGYPLKEIIKAYVVEMGYDCVDFGTNSEERTDYPLYAEKVTNAIVQKQVELGILICGTGIGMGIAANKVRGIRAAMCSEAYSACLSRQHNDANVLTFGARVVGPGLACSIVKAWLEADYLGGRHANRLAMIEKMEMDEHVHKE